MSYHIERWPSAAVCSAAGAALQDERRRGSLGMPNGVKQVTFAPIQASVEVHVYDLSIGLARAVSEHVVGVALGA